MDKIYLNKKIGTTLKAIRNKRKLSLDKVATITGVSKPMLAQIERGESNPTVGTLWKIAAGLSVPFSTFLEGIETEVRLVHREHIEPLKENDGLMSVVPLFPLSVGKPFEIYSLTIKPGCHYISDPHLKGVEEYNFIEEGEMTLQIQETSYHLTKGDGIRFTADVVHTYINHSDQDCRFLTMIYYNQS